MKKVIDSYGERIKPVELYLDDIKELVEIFYEISSEVRIEANSYEFEGVQELKKLNKETIDNLTISIHDPYVHLGIDNSSQVWLYIDKDVPMQRGIFEKLKKKLQEKTRKKNRYILSPFLPMTIAYASFFYLITYIKKPIDYLFIITVLALISSSYWTYSSINKLSHTMSIIHLENKIDSPNFWKRNKDQIVVAIVSSTIGAIAGFLLSKLI